MRIRKIISDGEYQTTIEFLIKNKTIMPNIQTAIEMTNLANKMDLSLQRMDLWKRDGRQEELKNIIQNYPKYNEKERSYLLYHLESDTI